jgi:hypothetical protein
LNGLVARADAGPGSPIAFPGGDLTVFVRAGARARAAARARRNVIHDPYPPLLQFAEPWAELLYTETFPAHAAALRAALADDGACAAIFEQLSSLLAATGDAEVDAVIDAARASTITDAVGATGHKLPEETRGVVAALVAEMVAQASAAGVVSAYAAEGAA